MIDGVPGFSIDLDADAYRRIVDLTALEDKSTAVLDVARRAFAVYETILRETNDGAEIYSRKDGEETKLEFGQ